LKLKKESDPEQIIAATSSPKKVPDSMSTMGSAGFTIDSEKKARELEKKVTKLRNEK
jgi:hypothetical protein